MTKFFGRESELEGLNQLLKKNSASLIVLRGRRRIGKSRLAEEFSKQFTKHFIFSGLPPTKQTTDASQKAEFRRQMKEYGMSYESNDWGDLFTLLATHCKSGRILIVLDEITWMGSKDPDFLGKLKIVWDLHFKSNPKLIFIISGSNSAWIENNILSSTGFFGRVSYNLVLEELPLHICNQFWREKTHLISSYEKFKLLGVTGGVPRYLEEILPHQTAEENIHRLCFTKNGILFSEFDNIFNDLFNGRNDWYRKIVKTIINGSKSLEEIAQELDREKGGDLSKALDELKESGFISKDSAWHIKNGEPSKISQYRVRDNYIRFYLKYVEPKKETIEKGVLLGLPPTWLSIMGLQFENLILNNLHQIIDCLHIPNNEIITAGRYLQSETLKRKKCQIDLMIQTKFDQLYICEVKFAKGEIGVEIVDELKEKIKRLERPKGFSCRPVLFHVNGVSDSVIESEYFSQIIDFGQFLRG